MSRSPPTFPRWRVSPVSALSSSRARPVGRSTRSRSRPGDASSSTTGTARPSISRSAAAAGLPPSRCVCPPMPTPPRSKPRGERSRPRSTPPPPARMPSPIGRMRTALVAEGLPLTLRAYRLLTAAATPFAPALISHRLRHGKELPARLNERYGESEFAVLCTSGTVTSANLAEHRLPKGVIHQFVILDTPRFVKRFIDHWRPDLALFVESDLWPNLIMTSAERGIPLILINGRVSERSFNRWRRVPGTIAALLRCFDLCLAQSAAHAARYRELGAPHVTTTGNLKFDVPEPPADPASLA